MFFWHMIGNRFLTSVTNVLYNTILSDMETCYKAFTREVANKLHLRARGWGFDPEITAQILLSGYRIYEVPISLAGVSSLRARRSPGATALRCSGRCSSTASRAIADTTAALSLDEVAGTAMISV